MQVQSMQDLFLTGLQYAYDAEKQLTEALVKMAQASTSPQLRQAFEAHAKQTQQHVERDEQVFSVFGKTPETKPNTVVKAMTQESEQMMGMIEASPLRDAALIVAGNQIEHYEMAAYGSLRNFAELLGQHECVQLLQQTLQEEKQADARLTDLGESEINRQAANKSAAGAAAS